MRRYLSFGGIAAVALALLSLRCGEAIPDGGSDVPVDASEARAPAPNDAQVRSDGTILDAGADANADADVDPDAGGDPSLARFPRTSCYSSLDDAGTVSLFPGYGIFLFGGERGSTPIADTTGKLFYCAGEQLFRFELGYPLPAASHRPSLTILREGLPDEMVVDYVLESVATPTETIDDVLAGPFMRAGTTTDLLVLAVAIRAPTTELALIRVKTSDAGSPPGPVSLGNFAGPTHIRLETSSAEPGLIAWKITATNATSTIVRTGTDPKPDAAFGMSFGTSRTAPGNTNVATFSEVKLP